MSELLKKPDSVKSPDQGTAYGMAQGEHDADLTEVGPGAPMGELMRRYWQPVELSRNVNDLPLKVRILGEDLVLFRNKQGRAGLLHHRCMHRGTSLFYGKCEDDGIRCCYHGWKFDTEGRVLDQPGEPQGGLAKQNFRQPWYPVEERYGLVWAYMGPPDKKPLMPVIEIFEDLEDGEYLFTDDNNIGTSAPWDDNSPMRFNWLQHFENLPDQAHFPYLHIVHSGAQFQGGGLNEIFERDDFVLWEFVRDSISWNYTDAGHASHMIVKPAPDKPAMRFTLEAALPAWRCVPNPWGALGRLDHIGFVVPLDDASFKIFTVLRGKEPTLFHKVKEMNDTKWSAIEKDPTYRQTNPDDYEAQYGQGEITYHSEENLVTTDRGVSQLRKLYREQLERIKRGEDPINVGFEPGDEVVKLVAGLYIESDK